MAQNDRPPIAEKVRFWEEQDRINQALIPRFLELHESVVKLGKAHTQVSDKIAVTEARSNQYASGKIEAVKTSLATLTKEGQSMSEELVKVKAHCEGLDNKCENLDVHLTTLGQTQIDDMSRLDLRVSELQESIQEQIADLAAKIIDCKLLAASSSERAEDLLRSRSAEVVQRVVDEQSLTLSENIKRAKTVAIVAGALGVTSFVVSVLLAAGVL